MKHSVILAHLYGLPKTHKKKLAVRPILSATNTDNYALAKWLDDKPKPLSLNQHTVADISDFVNEVRELKINKGYILVLYVSSLFTNILLDETIAILAEKAFRDNWFNSTYKLNISKEDLIDLLNVSTKGQSLQFNGALCEQTLFSRLDYPHHLINSTINTFINSRVVDQQPLQASGTLAGNDVTRVIIPFKDQDSANIVKMQLKDISIQLQTTIKPVFVSRKIGQDLKECETKPQLVNQQCVVYQF